MELLSEQNKVWKGRSGRFVSILILMELLSEQTALIIVKNITLAFQSLF